MKIIKKVIEIQIRMVYDKCDTKKSCIQGGEKLEYTLKQMRRIREKTQKQMALKLGVTEGTYRTWEHCPARVQVGTLFRILHILDFKITDLKMFLSKDTPYTDTTLDFEETGEEGEHEKDHTDA